MKLYINFKCFALISCIVNSVVKCEKLDTKNNLINVLRDLPSKEDLNHYLNSLENVLNYSNTYKNKIDINFAFGLFLVNVNLKYIAKVKHNSLPKNLQLRMTDILRRNDDSLKFFNSMVKEDHDPEDEGRKLVLSLFSNETLWTDRIRNFHAIFAKKSLRRSNKDLEDMYSKWTSYIEKVDDVNKSEPKPGQSDKCLESLASNPIRQFNSLPSCEVPGDCYNLLVNGSNFGYALTHRILMLLFARLGRGCTLFSPLLDKELTQRFCTIAYEEAEFITRNGYKIVDLLMEQIALCTLDGHSQFIRRSWMKNILQHQSPHGCFGQDLKRDKNAIIKTRTKWKMMNDQPTELSGGGCDGHTTALAAATLATAVRFLLIVFY